MKDIKIPGVLWIAAAIALDVIGRQVIEQYGFPPMYADVLLVVIVAVLKTLNIGTSEIDQALEIIDKLQKQSGATTMSIAGAEQRGMATHKIDLAKRRPNKIMRWMLG